MTKLKIPFTILVIASIMIVGGLIASPDAYSDKKHDNVPDECQCEKPHTLTVLFEAPDGTPTNTAYSVEIFKKLEDRNDEEKRLGLPFPVVDDGLMTIFASNFSKEKLESNTAFVIYEVGGEEDSNGNPVPVSLMEIHTSCSKPLFLEMPVDDSETTNAGFKLTVKDGLSGDPAMTSIPIANASICEDEKKKSTGSITIKKALTNDNGGTAAVGDFEITITNVEDTTKKIILVHDEINPDNPLINVNNVPAGTYTISEKHPTDKGSYTTVLIAGDTGCPSMEGEEFTIKKNKNLSCIIYNDDNGDGSDGFVFQKNSMQILIEPKDGDDETYDSCDGIAQDVDYGSIPCIQLIDNAQSGGIAIVDPMLGSNTRTIVLFSIVENEFDGDGINDIFDDGAANAECTLISFKPHSHDDLSAANPTTNTAVELFCSGLKTNEVININYIMIDPFG